MKQRLISATIAALILIPIVYIGGILYKIAVIVLGLIALRELIKAKESKGELPLLVKLSSYLALFVGLFNSALSNSVDLIISPTYILLVIVLLLLELMFYKDNKNFNIETGGYLLISILISLIGFSLLMNIREYSLNNFIILILITISSDTFAYVTGLLIGKHKLCPDISPKKTIEGFIGGLLFCLIICVPLFITLLNYDGEIFRAIIFVTILSLMSTLGDLSFSLIKRQFDIKDFGNIMPGHGGVLDRVDSLMFVLFTYYALMGLL